jgi:aspartate/methionine/tyrosine aminotransferase
MSDLVAMADARTERLWNELTLGYTESPGHPLLRSGIAEMYDSIDEAHIVVVVPEEGIFLIMNALLEPGDHVVCAFPAYQSLYEIARSIGCKISLWEPSEEKGWCFEVEDLEAQIKPNTKLAVINFPHNPTGYLPSKAEFEALIDLVRRRGIYLLSDEMYRFLEHRVGTALPSACDLYERAFCLSGLSKAYGLPGLRIGWLASQDAQILTKVQELKDYTTICGSAPSEVLAIIALDNREAILKQQKARLRRNLAALDDFFGRYEGLFRWYRPLGGSVCFPKVLCVQDSSDFCERLREETGIVLLPSREFQFGNRHVRIGFGRENLPFVVEIFSGYLDQLFRE